MTCSFLSGLAQGVRTWEVLPLHRPQCKSLLSFSAGNRVKMIFASLECFGFAGSAVLKFAVGCCKVYLKPTSGDCVLSGLCLTAAEACLSREQCYCG